LSLSGYGCCAFGGATVVVTLLAARSPIGLNGKMEYTGKQMR